MLFSQLCAGATRSRVGSNSRDANQSVVIGLVEDRFQDGSELRAFKVSVSIKKGQGHYKTVVGGIGVGSGERKFAGVLAPQRR